MLNPLLFYTELVYSLCCSLLNVIASYFILNYRIIKSNPFN